MSFKDRNYDTSSCTSRGENVTPPLISTEEMEILKSYANIRTIECNEYDLVEAIENNDSKKVAESLG